MCWDRLCRYASSCACGPVSWPSFIDFRYEEPCSHLRAERCVRCFRLRIYVFSSVQNQEYNNWKNVGSSWKRLSIVYSTLRHCGIYGSERGREILNKFVELMMDICLSCPSLRMQSKDLWRPCVFRHALREIDLDWCCWKIAVHMCIPHVLA